MKKLITLMKNHYNLAAIEIEPMQGGWASLAFQVKTDEQKYFLKMYDKKRAATKKLTKHIDDYLPVMNELQALEALNGKLPVPVKTNQEAWRCEDDQGIYVLFDYILGETIGSRPLTQNEITEFATMVAALHSSSIPYRLVDHFSLPFIQDLATMIAGHANESEVIKRIHEVEQLGESLRANEPMKVLTHTDLHMWNVMKTDGHLMLIDWEGLKVAPVEADLMFIVGTPYEQRFLQQYKKLQPNFQLNEKALSFYQGRRKLEDISELLEQLVAENQTKEEREETKRLLDIEVRNI